MMSIKATLICIATVWFSFFTCTLAASYQPFDDDCIIRADLEPNPTLSIQRPNTVSINAQALGADWFDLEESAQPDGAMAVSSILGGQSSKTMRFSGFYHDIPIGAAIHGVQLRISGQSTNSTNISESQIQFFWDESPIGINLAGKSNISVPWKENLSSWLYGYEFSDWGINWNREVFRSPRLSIKLALSNLDALEMLEVGIDGIELIVHYTEAYTVCDTDCVVLYNDEVAGATDYLWDVPDGVKFLNNDPTHRVVNLDFAGAENGLLEIGLRIVKGLDTLHCSRDVLHEQCHTATVGNYVWFDEDYDGIQDINENGVEGVSLQLVDQYSEVIQSLTSASDGSYLFENVESGFYAVRVVSSDLIASPFQSGNSEEDSDLKENLSTDIFYVGGGDSIADLDLGLFAASSITGLVWNECDGNGQLDTEEEVIVGQVVQLWRDNSLQAETITDESGIYVFDQLIAGEYTIRMIDIDAISSMTNAMDPDVSNVFLADGSYTINLDIGVDVSDINASIQPFLQIDSKIFFDEDGDGLMSDDEQIFNGDSVSLMLNNIVIDVQPIIDGRVQWTDLPQGIYNLQVDIPAEYTLQEGPNFSVVEQDEQVVIIPIMLNCLEQNTIDLIFVQAGATLGDYIWNDADFDGLQGADEEGIAGVTLRLIDFTSAEIVQETISDANGSYLFDQVQIGKYVIELIGINDNLIVTTSQVDPNSGSRLTEFMGQYFMGPIDVINNEDQLFWDGGFHQVPATIGDFAWLDLNKNGILDSGEPGIPGTTVRLFDTSDALVTETVTDTEGHYSFQVSVGSYYLQFSNEDFELLTEFQVGSNEAIDSDADPSNDGKTAVFTVSAGEVREDLDGGFAPKTATVGDRVFLDENGDGLQGDTEIGLSNFLVQAFTAQGELIASDTTDEGGFYSLEVPVGTYYLKFSKATFDEATFNNTTDLDINSDITEAYGPGTTDLITLAAFDIRTDIDAGFLTVSTLIGDFVWQELDINGLQDDGEIGLANMTVNLIKLNQGIVASTKTGNGMNADRGYYSFNVNQPGEYYIQFVLPDGSYTFTDPDVQDDEADSDVSSDNGFGTTATFFIEPGEPRTDIDAGVIGTNAIIGDFVWRDENNNGVQDQGEDGINGLNVFLYDEFFNFLAVTITTFHQESGKNGYYEFGEIEAGNYILVFDTDEQFVAPKVGANPEIDSDVTSTFVQGSTELLVLQSASTMFNVDAGLVNPNAPQIAQIGDMVWEDENKNGIYEVVEKGVGQVLIELVNEQGNVIAATISAGDGSYKFQNIPVGKYRIDVQLPAKYSFTIPDNSADDWTDSDVNELGVSELFSVTAGQSVDHIDIGLIPDNGVIEGVTWSDNNANGEVDNSEQFLSDIVVQLWNTDQELVAKSTTDNQGYYIFHDLPYGTYTVSFNNLAPYDYVSSQLNDNMEFTVEHSGASIVVSDVEVSSNDNTSYLSVGLQLNKTMATNYIDLNAFEDGNIHQLQWTSSIANTADYFEIQRSAVGGEWISIAEVKAEELQHYFMQDYDGYLIAGHVGYRIIQHQKDGEFFYSSESWILDDQQIDFTIYPNPSSINPTMTFVVEDDQSIKVSIMRADGSFSDVVLQQKNYSPGEYSRMIDASGLPSGVYYIRFEKEGSVSVQKLIIAK